MAQPASRPKEWKPGSNVPTDQRSKVTLPSTNVPLNELTGVLRCLENPPKAVDLAGSLTGMVGSVALIVKSLADIVDKPMDGNLVFPALGVALLAVQANALYNRYKAKDVHHDAAVATVQELITLHETQSPSAFIQVLESVEAPQLGDDPQEATPRSDKH